LSRPIYHLANLDDYAHFRHTGTYSAPSLNSEGFIHCCSGEQLPGVIQRYYIDASQLVLLHIDANRLTAELVYENTVGGTETFPHVYGKIIKSAVMDVVTLDASAIARIAASDQYQS